MASAHKLRHRWPLVLAVLLAFAVGASQAMQMAHYDLDSLIYLCTDIIEGEIITDATANSVSPAVDVNVLAVYKGAYKRNETLHVSIGPYTKAGRTRLGKGDRCFFFLDKPRGPGGTADKKTTLHAVPSGIRLIHENQLLFFRQGNNPGPYLAVLPGPNSGKKFPTVEEFRKQLGASLQKVESYKPLLDPSAGKPDGDRLLKILAERSGQPADEFMEINDKIAEVACQRLAELREPEFLFRALVLTKDYFRLGILGRGFGTPAGRDYLLAAIGDPGKDMATRVRCARTLPMAGPIYKSEASFVRPHTGDGTRKPDPNNSDYLTRIARAALAQQQNEELCFWLIESLRTVVRESPPKFMDAQMSSDLQGAMAVMQELHNKNPPEKVLRALAMLDPARAREALRQADLQRPKEYICKMDISLRGDRLSLQGQYNAETFDPDVTLKTSVVFINEATKAKHIKPTSWVIPGGARRSFGASFLIPKALQAGKYKVFAEVSNGNKVVATTDPLVIELPATR